MADQAAAAAAAASAAADHEAGAADPQRARLANRRGLSRPNARGSRRKPAKKPEGKAPSAEEKGQSRPQPAPAERSAADAAVDALRFGRDEELDALLPQLDANKRTPRGDALLVEACRFARVQLAARLVKDHKADVNLASTNKGASRAGLTPLIAACMALQSDIVDLLLGTSAKVDLLKTFGKVNAATVCVLFSVPNGRTEEQNEKATGILEKLIDYAARTEQLEGLLAAKPDQVNPLLHVAAALSNWRVIELLQNKRAYSVVDMQMARNARGNTALHSLEMNAFQARNLQMCDPPRPSGGDGQRHSKKGSKKRQNHKGKKGKEEEVSGVLAEGDQEPQSEADRQTFTRSRPIRTVEGEHVTKAVMELAKSTGIPAIFSRKGDSGVRAIYIKSLVLAKLGIVEIANQIAKIPDDDSQKLVYLDGLMYSVTNFYPLAVKNPKEYRMLWNHALYGGPKPEQKQPVDASQDGDSAAPSIDVAPELSPTAFAAIFETLMSHQSLSRRLKVWSVILMSSLGPYRRMRPLTQDERPPLEKCLTLSFYRRINETLFRSGVKLLFSIFDRTDIEEDESYDEEIEFHLIIALFEHFLQFFVPYARTIRDDSANEDKSATLSVAESFRQAVAPVTNLWLMLRAGLENMDDAIASPQRFSLILHILQVLEQIQVAFDQNADLALKKLFKIMKTFVKQESTKKHVEEYVTTQVRLLQTVSNAFPLPPSFIQKLEPLKDKLDMLLRSDPKILGVDLYALASAGNGLVRLEHKVDYLGVLAEEHNGSVSVSISRASGANYVDFILQQVLSASARHLKGELNVTLINEPGVGIGVVREFFQIVQSCFFNPDYNLPGNEDNSKSKPAQHVSEIGSKWLEEARAQASPRGSNSGKKKSKREERPKTNEMTSFFPLFELIDANNKRRDELRIVRHRPRVTAEVMDSKRATGELPLALKDLVVDKVRNDSLKKIYQCVGRLLGLAIRNHQPLDSNFPLTFWKFMCNDNLTWQDHCESNDVFARSLQQIFDHDFDTEPLDLQFEHTAEVDVISDSASKTKIETVTMEVELESNKGQEKVTNSNKAKYVELRAKQFFFGNELELYKKIREGLLDTIQRSDLRLFQPAELRRVVRGERDINLESLKKSVLYSRGASPAHGVIQRFWEVVEAFDQAQRAQLLTFWSGSPLPPVFGFESKHRSMNADTACWYIDVDPRMHSHQCPMANTCDRRLIIPDYPTVAQLKQKLLVALEHGAVGYDRM